MEFLREDAKLLIEALVNRLAIGAAIVAACSTFAAAQQTKGNDARLASFDDACVKAASAYVSNTESSNSEEMPKWIAKCEQHPKQEVCQAAASAIRDYRNFTPLQCAAGQALKGNDARPSLGSFDDACVNAASAYVSNTEASHSDEMPKWIAKCEQHPKQEICRDTTDFIRQYRNFTPLHCKGLPHG
jgi:hypothetical protein